MYQSSAGACTDEYKFIHYLLMIINGIGETIGVSVKKSELEILGNIIPGTIKGFQLVLRAGRMSADQQHVELFSRVEAEETLAELYKEYPDIPRPPGCSSRANGEEAVAQHIAQTLDTFLFETPVLNETGL